MSWSALTANNETAVQHNLQLCPSAYPRPAQRVEPGTHQLAQCATIEPTGDPRPEQWVQLIFWDKRKISWHSGVLSSTKPEAFKVEVDWRSMPRHITTCNLICPGWLLADSGWLGLGAIQDWPLDSKAIAFAHVFANSGGDGCSTAMYKFSTWLTWLKHMPSSVLTNF